MTARPSARNSATPVLHICAGNQYGGVESMLACIARESPSDAIRRHEFACAFEGRFAGELRAASAAVHRLPEVRLSRPWEVFRSRAALRSLVAATRPTAIITHSAWARLVYGGSLVHPGIPTIAWIHGASSPPSRLDRWGQRPRPDLVLTNSTYTREITNGLFPGVLRHVLTYPVPRPPALPPETRNETRARLGVRPGQTVLAIAARLEAWKGHAFLLDGLARIPAGADWTCWVAGGPQTPEQEAYLPALQDRARRLGIADRIAFLGERKDVPQLMAAADIYCQPNTGAEPFGIVFIEALYAGIPVVATTLGGALEIVTDACGRLVSPNDAAALGQALAGLITDPDLRHRLGHQGPARAAELCDPHRQITELNRLIADTLPANRPA